MRNFIELPSVNNVAAGQKFILNCPIGMTYDQIQFKLTNIDVSASEITNFKVKVGARTIIDVADLNTLAQLNSFYGRAEDSGYFTLWFYRPEKDTHDERQLYSLGTMDVPSLTIEGTLDAGVTSPAIEARASQRAPSNMGVVTKIKEFPATFSTTGQQQIDNIPRTPTGAIQAVHLGKADVTNVAVQVNYGAGQQEVIQAAKGDIHALQKQYGRTPVTASFTHIDFDLMGKIAGPLITGPLKDFRVKPTIGSTGSVNTVVEYAEGAEGI